MFKVILYHPGQYGVFSDDILIGVAYVPVSTKISKQSF